MNKFLLLFWLLISVPVWSQDSSVVVKTHNIKYTEEDIYVDNEPILVKPKFESGLKQKYKSGEFQYEVKVSEKNAWDRFKEWLAYWFKKLFGLSNVVDFPNTH